jgi:hypothetical protein
VCGVVEPDPVGRLDPRSHRQGRSTIEEPIGGHRPAPTHVQNLGLLSRDMRRRRLDTVALTKNLQALFATSRRLLRAGDMRR